MTSCWMMQKASAYHDGELPPAEARAFEDHLRDCAECRDELQQLSTLSARLSAMPQHHIPAFLTERLYRNAGRARLQPTVRLAEELMAAAAAILIIFGGWLFLGVKGGTAYAAASSWERAAVTLRADAANDTQQFAQWVVEDLSVEKRND